MENHMQNLDSSFLSIDERGNIIPKTPEAALVAAQAYLLTTQPALGDPRESMHQAAIKGLGLIGDKLNQEEIPQKNRSPHQQNSPQQSRRSRRSRSPYDEAPQPCQSRSPRQANHGSRDGDARNIITQARVKRSRYEWDKGNYEDEETEMGASCFICRVRKTQVPKGFKLPPSYQDTWGLQSISYAKFAATPHQHITVLVEQITQRIYWKLE
jgi:hypothetical protein